MKMATRRMLFPLQLFSNEELPQDTIEEVIVRRGSTREFSRESITFASSRPCSTARRAASTADFRGPEEPPLNELYLIVHAVEAFRPAPTSFAASSARWSCLKKGTFAAKRAISAWARRFRRIAASMFIF